MINKSFTSTKVADGSTMDIWLTWPEERRVCPAVILLHEAFGLNAYIQSVAERLCMAGYAVLAPDLLHRAERRLQLPYTFIPSGQEFGEGFTAENAMKDITASLLLSQSVRHIRHDRIGVLGFGIGGKYAFMANCMFPLAAGVSYYGYGIETLAVKPVDMQSRHLFFWAGRDAFVTTDQVNQISEWNIRNNRDFTSVSISYAEHGFHCDERSSYHPLAARQAWMHTLGFLDYLLK
jgi:carboxymethylenebutenolidase